MNDDGFTPGLMSGVVATILIAWFVDFSVPITVESHSPITPELTITVANGKTDTLYTYTEPE